jgi:ribonuclease BN (tRNA processing enzyme)
MVARHCGFDPVARLAELRAQRARLARQGRADSLAQVVSIELVPPEGTIEMSQSDSVLGRSIVKRVKNRKGEVLTTYQLEFEISYPDQGRTLTFSGDVLPLELGANDVTVLVNGVPATRQLRYNVHQGATQH